VASRPYTANSEERESERISRQLVLEASRMETSRLEMQMLEVARNEP
jgi:hypothetical protein